MSTVMPAGPIARNPVEVEHEDEDEDEDEHEHEERGLLGVVARAVVNRLAQLSTLQTKRVGVKVIRASSPVGRMPTRRTFSVTLNTMHQHSLAEGKVDSAQFIRERLPEILRALPAVEEEAGFALPSRTLLGLEQIIRELALENIFEFGSGRSTKVFLDCGCNVSALEHDAAWAEQTLQSLPAEQRGRLVLRCDPLRKVFVAGAPMKGWILDEHSANALAAAQLVLIDSPPLPPFREHALVTSLRLARNALIIVDDAKIPTVHRFCTRLAAANDLEHYYAPIDHGLFFFASCEMEGLRVGRDWRETIKAWKRYVLA